MFDAVVLAGGTGRRLGDVDKATLVVHGVPLLDRVLAAVAHSARTVVVGPPRPLPLHLLQIREEPPGGGPAAALAAGLGLVSADVVVVLACDLALVSEATTERLLHALTAANDMDGAVLVDGGGRRQPLLAAYRTAALRAALDAERTGSGGGLHGAPLFRVVDRLAVREIAATGAETLDCDTWDDVATAERRLLEATPDTEPITTTVEHSRR